MGPMRWFMVIPGLGVGAIVAFIIMIGFIFLRRGMMGGRRSMRNPRGMEKWNRMGAYGPTDPGSTTGASQSVEDCPSCGQPIQAGWMACPHCGQVLE